MVPMNSHALLQSQWINGHCCGVDGFVVIVAVPMDSLYCICCGADGFMEIVVVPMDSWSLLRCQLIHGNCCGTDRFTEIVVVPMDSQKLLWCRWIHVHCCRADGFTFLKSNGSAIMLMNSKICFESV